jgi:hypothetical protein
VDIGIKALYLIQVWARGSAFRVEGKQIAWIKEIVPSSVYKLIERSDAINPKSAI